MMPTHGPSLRAHRGSVVLRDGAEFGAEQDAGLERMEPTRSLELTGRTVWPLQGLKDVWETLVLVERTSWVCGCLLRCLYHYLSQAKPRQKHPSSRQVPWVRVHLGGEDPIQAASPPPAAAGAAKGMAWPLVVRSHLTFPSRETGKFRLLSPSEVMARTPLVMELIHLQ